MPALEPWVHPVPRGDPRSLRRWTGKRAAPFAPARQAQGHAVRARTVTRRLHDLGDRLQSTRKTRAGRAHPEREAPCPSIHRRAKAVQQPGPPVVAVAPNKQARLGPCRHGGRAWPPPGPPAAGQGPDGPDQAVGQGRPSGVSDDATQTGGGRVGVEHDTAALAGATVRRWGRPRGRQASPRATR